MAETPGVGTEYILEPPEPIVRGVVALGYDAAGVGAANGVGAAAAGVGADFCQRVSQSVDNVNLRLGGTYP